MGTPITVEWTACGGRTSNCDFQVLTMNDGAVQFLIVTKRSHEWTQHTNIVRWLGGLPGRRVWLNPILRPMPFISVHHRNSAGFKAAGRPRTYCWLRSQVV